MKSHFKTLVSICIIGWSALGLNSCVNSIGEEKETSAVTPGDVPIKITAKRLHTQIYQKNCEDAIGLYVLLSPATLDKERYVENKRFDCTASGFEADKEVYYPAEKSNCDFISYYPYQESGIAGGGQSIDISVCTDQSADSEYNHSDFMTAIVKNISSGKKSVELPYLHQLCQLSIRIKVTEGYDINILKKSNPSVRINEAYTQAIYDFDTNEFSSLTNPQNVIPNGVWKVDNNTLTGKKSILIPQMVTAGNEILTLTVDSKKYECRLTENYQLESDAACELTILYDPTIGISGIETDINDWKEGSKSEITPVEKEEKTEISVCDFDFEESSVYNIRTSEGKLVAEVCKEYLSADGIHAQAIVIYPVKDGSSDWSDGTVLEIVDEKDEVHGGRVSWYEPANVLNYLPGNQAPFTSFHITSDLSIVFYTPIDPLLLSIEKKTLTDGRGKEAVVYPIVKIGTQYWMRENLKTTLYNDGKKITAKTSSNYAKSSAGYFKNSSYIFYNKAVVTSGKLAPKGWKIADDKAWKVLKTYLNGDANLLKGRGLWKESDYTLEDLTGFNAIPTGGYTKKKEEDYSIYGFAKEYAIFWNMGDDPKTLAEKGVLLRYDSDKITSANYSDYCGYSVRCVMELR